MTVRVDYSQLDQPAIRLSLVHVRENQYIVWDQHCRFYILVPSPLQMCLRFLQAGADKGDWLVDDASVERAAWHSVRVLGEVPVVTGDDGTGTSPSTNVVAFRRRETA